VTKLPGVTTAFNMELAQLCPSNQGSHTT